MNLRRGTVVHSSTGGDALRKRDSPRAKAKGLRRGKMRRAALTVPVPFVTMPSRVVPWLLVCLRQGSMDGSERQV